MHYLPTLFAISASQKLSFWDPFSITFSTPFWDPLWKSLLAHLGRQRCRPCLPMSILDPFWDPPWIQNGTLERPGAPRKCQKSQLPESRIASRDRHGSDPCPKGVPQAILIDFGTPLGDQGSLLGPPWVTKVLIRDPLGCHKARFETPG